jgi:hypothetical protein
MISINNEHKLHESTNGRIGKSFRWTVVNLARLQSLWEKGRANDMLANEGPAKMTGGE